MSKKSFLRHGETAIALLSMPTSVDQAIALARTARDAGADGVTFELQKFPPELRTVENFKAITSSVQLPFMFTDYRTDIYYGADDEARMETLFKAAEGGAEFIDVMGDLYCASPFEITTDEKAVERQKETIAKLHAMGVKVVMSSHSVDIARTAEECVAQLHLQESRGPDIVKLVTLAQTRADFLEGITCLMRLNREMKTPWIYLNSGPYARMQRMLGPHFGCAVEFAVGDYFAAPNYDQPTIQNFKKAGAAIAWHLPDGE